jgi:hypothetical protein
MGILLGADPEVFATKQGKLVSAHGMIPGTKENPFPVQGGAVQVDGMALEFNIDPARNADQFVMNLRQVMMQLRLMVPGHKLLATPVAEFGREMIDAQPDEAKELGCDPDFNAYLEGAENPIPNVNAPFRTGAGHVHIGLWDPNGPLPVNHNLVCCELAKQLDCYLAAPMAFLDMDPRRRELYGKAGAFRPKPYGMEYRVLSNKWLSSAKVMRWVHSNTMLAVSRMQEGGRPWDYAFQVDDMVNTGDLHEISRMVDMYDIPLPYGARKIQQDYL